MPDPTTPEILDGLALWQEHKPQTGEDWVAVAERFIADGCTTEQSSPLFAGLVLAVRQHEADRQRIEDLARRFEERANEQAERALRIEDAEGLSFGRADAAGAEAESFREAAKLLRVALSPASEDRGP